MSPSVDPPSEVGGRPAISRGFLVVALSVLTLVFLLALAVPAWLRARQVSSMSSGVSYLQTLVAAEEAWRVNAQGDGRTKTYWTADVYGLSQHVGPSGRPDERISIRMARTDRFPAKGPPYAAPPPPVPEPSYGCFFEALDRDEDGNPYALDADGDGRAWENASKFGFRAVPELYGTTGLTIFQVNETGVIFGRDLGYGAELNPPRGSWEGGADPAKADPPWRRVQ